MSLFSSWPPFLHSTVLQNPFQQRKRWRRERRNKDVQHLVFPLAVELRELVRKVEQTQCEQKWHWGEQRSPTPQDREQSELFSAALITFRRSHEGDFFFCLKQQQFAASHSGPNIIVPGRLRATGLAQDMVVGIKVGWILCGWGSGLDNPYQGKCDERTRVRCPGIFPQLLGLDR